MSEMTSSFQPNELNSPSHKSLLNTLDKNYLNAFIDCNANNSNENININNKSLNKINNGTNNFNYGLTNENNINKNTNYAFSNNSNTNVGHLNNEYSKKFSALQPGNEVSLSSGSKNLNNLNNNNSNNINNNNNNSNSNSNSNQSKFEKMVSLMGNDDEVNIVKCKILSNANVIKEYESWINLLLNVVNSTQKPNDYFDLATPLDSAMKKTESLAKDNLEINKKIIKEMKKNVNRENELKIFQKDFEILDMEDNLHNNIDEFINCDLAGNPSVKEKLEQEKLQISESINSVTDELEDLSNQNKILESSVKKENFQEVLDLWNEFRNLKEENNELNKILDLEKSGIKSKNNSKDNKSFISLSANKKDDLSKNHESSDVILYSYRKENESNKSNGHSMYVSCMSARNKGKFDEKCS